MERNEKFLGLKILVPLFKLLGEKRDKIKDLFQKENKLDLAIPRKKMNIMTQTK